MSDSQEYSNKELDSTKYEDFNYLGSREDTAESRTVASRLRLRAKVQDEIEEFIKSGGQIQMVDNNVLADPPRRPVSNYGGRPI
jgi:hypothetical protein